MQYPQFDWQHAVKDHLKTAKKPLIVMLGPTASGKTGFSVEFAKWAEPELGKICEVINADSRQLFSGMDIGTAKITEQEQEGVDHHLFDVLEPSDDINVAWYKQRAEECIDDILQRGNLPVLVGGSMLYIAAITDGLSFNKEVRTELRSPEAEGKYNALILGLGKDREEVVEKINNRTPKLFEAGWIDEVRRLKDRGFVKTHQGMKACGYREIFDFLEEGGDAKQLMEDITAKTRQYARRQMTWWRGDTRINWL